MRVIPAIFLSLMIAVPGSAERLEIVTEQSQISADFVGKAMPWWEHGRLLTHEVELPRFLAYDRFGRLAMDATISQPGVDKFYIYTLASSPDGRLAVAGNAVNLDGQMAGFLAFVEPTGVVTRFVRLGLYAALRMSFGPDGTLWAVGKQVRPDHRGEEESGYPVLRRYDRDGREVGAYLNRDSFPRGREIRPLSKGPHLVTSRYGVGLYSNTMQEWIEFSPSGEMTGRYPGPEQGRDRVTGVALTDSGSVYMSSWPRNTAEPQTLFYRLDRAKRQWREVDVDRTLLGDTPRSQYALIAGSDNEKIVLICGPGQSRLLWLKVE